MRSPKTKLRWKDLSETERAAVSNGCGGKGGWINPPELRFHASCRRHDFAYWRGGNRRDRLKADYGFLRATLRDATSGMKRFVLARVFLAVLYFSAVRCVGWRYFYYGPPRTRDTLSFRIHAAPFLALFAAEVLEHFASNPSDLLVNISKRHQ
jgi:hypothetical protein